MKLPACIPNGEGFIEFEEPRAKGKPDSWKPLPVIPNKLYREIWEWLDANNEKEKIDSPTTVARIAIRRIANFSERYPNATCASGAHAARAALIVHRANCARAERRAAGLPIYGEDALTPTLRLRNVPRIPARIYRKMHELVESNPTLTIPRHKAFVLRAAILRMDARLKEQPERRLEWATRPWPIANEVVDEALRELRLAA